jgi:hypothetical protein
MYRVSIKDEEKVVYWCVVIPFIRYSAASFMPSSLGPLTRGASVRHQLAFYSNRQGIH